MPARESRIPASSSTIRMLCMLGGRRCRRGLGDDGKFHDKTRADGMVLFYTDGAMVIFDNPADDGQAEARAPLLGGKIRQEEFFFELASHTVAGVGNRDLDGVAARHQRGRNLNLAYDGILRSLGGIVHQVGYGA